MKKPIVSLALPCYNEGKFIFKSIAEITKVMDRAGRRYEIILFDDCSRDSTLANIRKIASKNPRVKVFAHSKNVGRGGTVCDAIRKAQGSIVGFLDVDLEGSPKHIPEMIDAIEQGYDVAIGNRKTKFKLVHFHRLVFGKGYNFLEYLLLDLKTKDSQAGYKFFNRKRILPILAKTLNKHWFWDTEVMALAELYSLKIKEIDVEFRKNPESETAVRFLTDIPKYVRELLAFRSRLLRERAAMRKAQSRNPA